MFTISHFVSKPLLAAGTSALLCFQQESTQTVQASPFAGPTATRPVLPVQGSLGSSHRPDVGNRVSSRADKARLAAWVRRYKAANPGQPRAFYINEDLVFEILQQANPSRSSASKGGLRIYLGLDPETGATHAILVAVRKDGTDVLERNGQPAPAASLILGETDDKCPANCDPTSPLEQ